MTGLDCIDLYHGGPKAEKVKMDRVHRVRNKTGITSSCTDGTKNMAFML